MAMTTKKEKKQSKGPVGMTDKELKDLKKKLKFKKRLKSMRGAKPASRVQAPFDMDDIDMSMPFRDLSKAELKKIAKDSLLNKGGIVKKFKGGLMVKPKAAKRGY